MTHLVLGRLTGPLPDRSDVHVLSCHITVVVLVEYSVDGCVDGHMRRVHWILEIYIGIHSDLCGQLET